MWPLYAGVIVVLLWVAIDLLRKVRARPAEVDDTPSDAVDTDMFVRDLAACNAEGKFQ